MKPICVVHPEFPWCAVSLDGLDLDAQAEILLEIKCLGKRTHSYASRGTLPPYYVPQVQWQMFCTPSVKEAHYWSLDAAEIQAIQKRGGTLEEMVAHCKVVVVYPDPAHQQALFLGAKAFRESLGTGIPPAGDAWLQAARQYVLAKNDADEAALALKIALKQLMLSVPEIERVDGKKVEGGGASLSFFNKRGPLDTAALCAHLGLTDETLPEMCATLGVEEKGFGDFSPVDFPALLKHLGMTPEKFQLLCARLGLPDDKPYEDFCGKPELSMRFSITGEEPAPPPDKQLLLTLPKPTDAITGSAARDYNQW